MPNNNTSISDFFCTKCGNKGVPVVRTSKKIREPGHLKNLYCLYCGHQQNMAEIRPFGKYKYKDFYVEFKYHNFNEQGQRVNPKWKNFVSSIINNMTQEEYYDLQQAIDKYTYFKEGY